MPTVFIQFRVEETAKEEASLICKQLGMDLPTYLRICIARLNSCKGIPFDMRLISSARKEEATITEKQSLVPEKNSNDDEVINKVKAEIAALKNL